MSMSGNGGTMTFDTGTFDVGEWSMESEIPEIESTPLNGATYECKAGRVKSTFTAMLRFDAGAKAKLWPWFTTATPSKTAATALLTLGVGETISGSAILTRIGVAVKRNELVEVPIAGTFTGTITPS